MVGRGNPFAILFKGIGGSKQVSTQWMFFGATIFSGIAACCAIVYDEAKFKKNLNETDAEKERHLRAVRTAKFKTLRRLKKDKLASKGLDAVIDEYKFQEIVARFEE